MSWRELKAWQPMCNVCLKRGPVVHAEHRPEVPSNWSLRTRHDCGMTGYSRTETLCPECTRKVAER